ncbi:malate synthase A [Aeromonas cavernicola]|uniref:Malate synthase n=1 Tax=Aeromonas cavernicola TaxID=1006623 RepID=A0A2H9U5A0_9GAMM|nr:malate synthase A [Aeromonas cavernicola]PJG59169.1 malate synthase A [Aeromonas cavernicola]
MALKQTSAAPSQRANQILTPEALAFVASLHEQFAVRRDQLLAARTVRRNQVAQQGKLDFLPETAAIRSAQWQVASAPEKLRKRHVEITGPASPAKMAINALNSSANVWLADLEDANSPHWFNVIDSQINLFDAARGTLSYTAPEPNGKRYELQTSSPRPVIVVRPRGWHMDEAHLLWNDKPAVAALVDFGLHFFHNATLLTERGDGPFYYLPKMESHHEARLWNDIFIFAQKALGIPRGTVRATVLIETIPAAFEMEEILYELREHASGLNAGRWDYLFSIIKYFRDAGSAFTLPDRASVTMTAPFMRAYTELLVKTCHKRGAFAMGGMAAFIPNRSDPNVSEIAFEKVRADKTREANDGFDGSWVAHPDLIPICQAAFSAVLGDRPNQLDRLRDEVQVSAAQLLDISSTQGQATEAGLRDNLYVGIAYLGSWIAGNGAVAIRNQMEDAATAEISRSQVWQQIHSNVQLADTGRIVTPELVTTILAEETARLQSEVAPDLFVSAYAPASKLMADLCVSEQYEDFLTTRAYAMVTA